jgi:hypothetical protein
MTAWGRQAQRALARPRTHCYAKVMSTRFHAVAVDALTLDAADRLRLAAELIDSVEGSSDPAWDDAWLAEIQARRQRGTTDAVPWTSARDRAVRRITTP